MGVKLKRKKPKHLLLSIGYMFKRLIPLSNKNKLKLFLDLEWIFDRLAHEETFKIYSPDIHPIRIHSKKFILKHISKEQNVLDVGCNSGEISSFIADKAKTVVGIDYNEKVIRTAKSNNKQDNLSFETGEAFEYLSKQKGQFDVLILSHILEHLDDPKEFLMKFKDHFQFLYIEVPDFDKSYMNQYRLKLGSKLVYTDLDHITEFDREELEQLLNECNIKIMDKEYRFGVQKYWCHSAN